ncbi:MAG: hypothetical protein SGCHY_004084 [Lobulomycetales sp.]
MSNFAVRVGSETLVLSVSASEIRVSAPAPGPGPGAGSSKDVVLETQFCFAVTAAGQASSSTVSLSTLDLSIFQAGLDADARPERLAIHYLLLSRGSTARKPSYRPFIFALADPEQTSACLEALREVVAGSTRSILVLINPFAGKGKGSAAKTYNTIPASMFALAGIKARVIETESPGHATQLVRDMSSLDEFDVLVTVSGDGTFHELINGVMARDDWKKTCQIPLSMIAAGTAAALNKNLDTLWPALGALSIIKGLTRPLDVFSYFSESLAAPVYSHLNLTWAIIADVDIGSEKYRYLGDMRFTVGGLLGIFGLRRYAGSVYYIPAENDDENTSESTEDLFARLKLDARSVLSRAADRKPGADYSSNNVSHNSKEATAEANNSSNNVSHNSKEKTAEADNSSNDVSSDSKERTAKADNSSNDVSSDSKEKPTEESKAEPNKDTHKFTATYPKHNGPRLCHIMEDYTTWQGRLESREFTLFNLTNLSWIAPDHMSSPFVGLSSGSMDLIYAGADLTKSRLLSCFMDMTKGQYLKQEVFSRVGVTACVLEPGGLIGDASKTGYQSLSGESMPVERVMLELHPAAMRVCVPEHLDESLWMKDFLYKNAMIEQVLRMTKRVSESSAMTTLSKKYRNMMGYRQMGLRLDDLLPEENQVVQEAIRRLPPREYQDRIYRHRRALIASAHQDVLPSEQWTTEESDLPYMRDLMKQIEAEIATKQNFDLMSKIPAELASRNRFS